MTQREDKENIHHAPQVIEQGQYPLNMFFSDIAEK